MPRSRKRRRPKDLAAPIPATQVDPLVLITEQMIAKMEHWLKSPPEAEWVFMKSRAREQLRRGIFSLCEDMVRSAESGDLLAHEALIDEYRNLWNARAEIPRLVEEYFVRYADRPPERKPGPVAFKLSGTAVTNVRRDIGLSDLLAWLFNRYGLHPTHSEANDNRCGVDVLHAALRRRGIYIKPNRLRNIFTTWRKTSYDALARKVSFSFEFSNG